MPTQVIPKPIVETLGDPKPYESYQQQTQLPVNTGNNDVQTRIAKAASLGFVVGANVVRRSTPRVELRNPKHWGYVVGFNHVAMVHLPFRPLKVMFVGTYSTVDCDYKDLLLLAPPPSTYMLQKAEDQYYET
jgi:hypothetical protein